MSRLEAADDVRRPLCAGPTLRAGAGAGPRDRGRGEAGHRPHGDSLPDGPSNGRRDGGLFPHVEMCNMAIMDCSLKIARLHPEQNI